MSNQPSPPPTSSNPFVQAFRQNPTTNPPPVIPSVFNQPIVAFRSQPIQQPTQQVNSIAVQPSPQAQNLNIFTNRAHGQRQENQQVQPIQPVQQRQNLFVPVINPPVVQQQQAVQRPIPPPNNTCVIKRTMNVIPSGSNTSYSFQKNVRINSLNRQIQVLRTDQIPVELKKKVGQEFLQKTEIEQKLTDFLEQFNITDCNAVISKQKCEEYPQSIENRLTCSLTFYSNKFKLQDFDEKLVINLLFSGKPHQSLFASICQMTNPICALYAFANVVNYREKGITFKQILNPAWKGISLDQRHQNRILLDCFKFLLADINEYLNIFLNKIKLKLAKNRDLLDSLQNGPFFNSIQEVLAIENYSLFDFTSQAEKLGLNQEFLAHQINQLHMKLVQILHTLFKHPSFQFRETAIQEKIILEEKCTKFLTFHLENFAYIESVVKTGRKLINQLFEDWVPALIDQFIDGAELVKTKSSGDWIHLIFFLFDSQQSVAVSNLLQIYFCIQYIGRLKADVFMSGIQIKINSFIQKLKATSQDDTDSIQDMIALLSLCAVLSKIYFPDLPLPEGQQIDLGEVLIRNDNKKVEKIRELNIMFNLLLQNFLECRKDLAPIVMLVVLDVKDNINLQVNNDLTSQLIKPWMESPETHLNEANQLLHQRLQSQKTEEDQLFYQCVSTLLEKTIGKTHSESQQSILDVEQIFICWANCILEEMYPRSIGLNLPQIGKNIQFILNQLEYREEKKAKEKTLKNLQKIKVKEILVQQFEESDSIKRLSSFYNHFQNKKGASDGYGFGKIMANFPMRVRKMLVECLGYKLENRMMRFYMKSRDYNPQQDPLFKTQKQNPYKNYLLQLMDMNGSGYEFFFDLKHVRTSCEQERDSLAASQSSLDESSDIFMKEWEDLDSISPFKQSDLKDLQKEIFYDQYLSIINRLTIFNRLWSQAVLSSNFPQKQTTASKLVLFVFPSQLKPNPLKITKKQFLSLSQNFEAALLLANQTIKEAIALMQKDVDWDVSLSGLNNTDVVLTYNVCLNGPIQTLIDFMLHMRMFGPKEKSIKGTFSLGNIKQLGMITNLAQLYKPQSPQNLFDSIIFTPSLLNAIAECLRLKMTLSKIKIQTAQMSLFDQINLKETMIASLKSDIEIQKREFYELSEISHKLVMLVGDVIKRHFKYKPEEINCLLMSTIFFIRKSADVLDAELHIISALASLNPTALRLTNFFKENPQLLKMYRYIKFCQDYKGKLLINPETEKPYYQGTYEISPQQAAECFLTKFQSEIYQTANQYQALLYKKIFQPSEDPFLNIFKISKTDVLFLSSILKCIMSVVEASHQLCEEHELKDEEKDEMVKLFVIGSKIIEVSYQKLLQIVTFEKPSLGHTNLNEEDWNEYENLVHTIHDFKRFIENLCANEYEFEQQYSHFSVSKSLIYLTEVIEHCELEAGRYYREITLQEIYGKKEKPKNKMYEFLAEEPKEGKTKANKFHKRKENIDFYDPLVIGRKFDFD